MTRIARAPPVVGLALAAGSGAILFHVGISFPRSLLLLALLLLPIQASKSPLPGLRALPSALPSVLALLAGIFLSLSWDRARSADCRLHLPEDLPMDVSGRLLGPLVEGRGELRPFADAGGPCGEDLRLVVRAPGGPHLRPGAPLRVHGAWRRSADGQLRAPIQAGYLMVDSVELLRDGTQEHHGYPRRWASPGDLAARLGGWVQDRLDALFPESGPLAVALVWARKDGLDPDLRDAFSRAGTAHLLAISGFHVGVVAGVLLLALGGAGLRHSIRFTVASVGVWLYVLAIGLPAAAFRASLLLTVMASGRAAGRWVPPLGALASVFLCFLCMDPGSLLSPGFQLSFAGVLGLILGHETFKRRMEPLVALVLPSSLGRSVASGLAAGLAATLATLPLVAWHFGRVSLVGIPTTLLATPLVALAIPGILASLILSLLSPELGAFLASGVELDLQVLSGLVEGAARLPWASVWVSQTTLMGGLVGIGGAGLLLWGGSRSVRGARRWLLPGAAVVGAVAAPGVMIMANRGVLEMVVLDVGQGDALAIRSPLGRWMLVDAGPRTQSFDAGARIVVPYLRRRGVDALRFLILTHPDMDHVGGASAVLEELPVGEVVDPGDPAGTEVFLDVLETAGNRDVRWSVAEAGDSMTFDGVALRVLAPAGENERENAEGKGVRSEEDDRNASSLVLELRFGKFAAVLSGDAPLASEHTFAPGVLSPNVQVLKVGHHGSSTSTGSELVERLRPETALISVGRRNRYGHPQQAVLDRLREHGVRILRTDRDGTLILRARADGSYTVAGG